MEYPASFSGLLLNLRPNYIHSASNDIHTDGPRARARARKGSLASPYRYSRFAAHVSQLRLATCANKQIALLKRGNGTPHGYAPAIPLSCEEPDPAG